MGVRANGQEKLWRYGGLARLWARSLILSAVALTAISVALEATSGGGASTRWFAVLVGVTGLSGAIFVPLLRVWLSRAALPSLRLDGADRLSGNRRLEASPADWRRWSIVIGLVLLVSSAMMLTFLIGVLERGGTAEGVVIGTLLAWGIVTIEDARRIDRAEREQGRRYYASCRRPIAVAECLVWAPAAPAMIPPEGIQEPGLEGAL